MSTLVQTIVNAILFGGILSIAAVGFSLIFGVMNVINLAHGVFVIGGAYAALLAWTVWKLDPLLALPGIMVGGYIVGSLLQRFVMQPAMRRGNPVAALLVTFGFALVALNLMTVWFSSAVRNISPSYSFANLQFAGLSIDAVRLVSFSAGGVLIAALAAFLRHTRFGRMIRATAQSELAARRCGVDARRIYASTFGIGSAMGAASGVLIGMMLPFTPAEETRVALAMCISAGLALSWYILGGFSAYYSFGHTAFVGIGAFAAGLLQQAWPQQHWAGQLAVALVSGAAVSALLAALIAWPILRLRGHYFTIAAMLAMALVCAEAVNAFPALKGSIGLSLPNVAPPGLRPERFFFWTALVLLAITIAIAWAISRSRLGYSLCAIREDEDAAQMLGVPTTRIKTAAFVTSAALTGSYGALYALNLGYITTDSVFRGALSLEMIVNCLVGGMGSLFGPIVGAVAMTALTKLALADMLEYHLAITGLVVLLVVTLAPEGILGSIARWRRSARAARRRRPRAETPASAPAESSRCSRSPAD